MQKFNVTIKYVATKTVEIFALSEDDAIKAVLAESNPSDMKFEHETSTKTQQIKLADLKSMLLRLLVDGDGFAEFAPLTIGGKKYDSVNIENGELLVWDTEGHDYKADSFKPVVLYTIMNRAVGQIAEPTYTTLPVFHNLTDSDDNSDEMETVIPENEIEEEKPF